MSAKGFDHGEELPVEVAAALRTDARRMAERPEEFWSRQQTRIRGRIQAHRAPHRRGLRLAVAGAALVFVAVLLTAPARRPPPVTPRVAVDADQELLIAVEHALAAGTPEALEPLTLLVESSSNFNAAEPNSHKEHRNEN